MITRLHNELTKVDVEKGNLGTLSKEDFQAVLQAYFPHRTEENILLLLRAAETQLEAKEEEVLEYKNLFMEVCTRLGYFCVHSRFHTVVT